MLAFSLDNLLFLLLIAAAALFQLLSKTISKSKKSDSNKTSSSPTPQTPRPIQRAPRESDADRIRKFLEALGQPPSSTPPSPVLPRTNIPPRPLAPVQPPPALPRVWRLPRQRAEKSDVSQTESTPLEQSGGLQQILPPVVPASAAATFEVHEAFQVEPQQSSIIDTAVESDATASQVVVERAGSKRDIATLLGSKLSLRDAILIREILGPPRGLQTLDATL
jgi:hypothetical protein